MTRTLLERLQSTSDHEMSETDIESTKQRIDLLLNDGWQPEEVFRYLRWTEEVTETAVSEEICLKRMAKVKEEVNRRLGRKEKEKDTKMCEVLKIFELDAYPGAGDVCDALRDLVCDYGRVTFKIDGAGKTVVCEDVRAVRRNGEVEIYLVLK